VLLLSRHWRCAASLALALISLPGAALAAPTPPPIEPDPIEADAPPVVTLGLGPAVARRSFSYHDGLSGDLRSYSLQAAGGVAARLTIFPAARAGWPVLSDLGLVGSLHQAIGLQSQDPDGHATSTLWRRLDAGLRYRLISSPSGRLDLTAGYGAETFSFQDVVAAGAPSVDYRYLSGALGGELPLGPLALELRAAFHHVLDGGDLSSRLRGTTVAGVDGLIGLELPLAPWFGLSVGARYTRYFYSFKPEPGDALVAGGALDQSIRASLLAVGSF
jgi:hypothetical protein